MSRIFFPEGSRLGPFVTGTTLSCDETCCVCLAEDADGKKFTLTVFNSDIDPGTEKDMALWSSPQYHNFVAEIRVFHAPVPMIAVPFVAGLSIPEFLSTGRRFSEEEALSLLRLAADSSDLLRTRGCRNSLIGGGNMIVSEDGTVKLVPDTTASDSADPAEALRRLAEDILQNITDPGEETLRLRRELADLPPEASCARIAAVLTAPAKESGADAPPAGGKRPRIGLFAGTAALIAGAAAAGALVFTAPWRKSAEDLSEKTVRFFAGHRISGPQVYASAAAQEGPAVPPGESAAEPPPLRPAPAAPRAAARKPRSSVRKRSGSPRTARSSRPAAVSSPVAEAARRGNLMDLRAAISAKAPVDQPDASGRTALEYASSARWKSMIKILVDAGAKITPAALAAAGDAPTRAWLLALKNPRPAPPSAPKKLPQKIAVPNTSGWKTPERKMWHITLESAILRARPQKKAILVFFTSPDRNADKNMEKTVFFSLEFRRLAKDMELVYVNLSDGMKLPKVQQEYNRKLHEKLGRHLTPPSSVILGSDGKKVRGTIVGHRSKNAFLSELKTILR
ncbi:MAG: hypothetical protein IJS01_01510 [Lentisphaeria bacterium]|nr:hypothetical protein [Lentisphaeria bacterium]